MLQHNVGILVYNGITAMDAVGPMECFTVANDYAHMQYRLQLLAEGLLPVKSESGLKLLPDAILERALPLHTLLIPGGAGARDAHNIKLFAPLIQGLAERGCRIVSVCTGAYMLAETGLLDGKTVTTHWHFSQDLQQRYPKVNVNGDALYIDHGNIATSAGVSSGIDLALKLVENDCGAEVAIKVARFLVVHYRRAGNQAQFSEPLQRQMANLNQFAKLSDWILGNLAADLSLDNLADYCGMSVRTFSRKFREQTGQTPAKFVEVLRLDYARQLLTSQSWSVQRIASACGYTNPDILRRAFEKRYMLSPSVYRARFSH